ncbi:MAG TPA: gluconokinase [Gemmatimonadaceae bacterium]|nr:gluconokinase [Gemmatimonadaceae bacterium]
MLVIVVMGVAGAGKTTVGQRLAAALGWPFVDADDVHPPANVARMRAGLPLTDADRAPWLDALARLVAEAVAERRALVLACSALTRAYRRRLVPPGTAGAVRFVHLHATPALLAERLAGRPGHFFPPALLESQLDTLETPGAGEPAPVLTLDAAASPDALVAEIRAALGV